MGQKKKDGLGKGGREKLLRGGRQRLVVLDVFLSLIVVVVSQVYSDVKTYRITLALAGVAQWIECQPANWKGAGLVRARA